MSRGPTIKNIPEHTHAKMLALCCIAGINVRLEGGGSDGHNWILSLPASSGKGNCICLPNHAGYRRWQDAVKFLLKI